MKITPLGGSIQLKIEKVSAGALDTSSKATAIEIGEVVAVGEDVTLKVKKGDTVFFKSWACDIVNHEEKPYYFVNQDTKGILAVVQK